MTNTTPTADRPYTRQERLDWFASVKVGDSVKLVKQHYGTSSQTPEGQLHRVAKVTPARLTLEAPKGDKPLVIDRTQGTMHGSWDHVPHPNDFDLQAEADAESLLRRLNDCTSTIKQIRLADGLEDATAELEAAIAKFKARHTASSNEE